MQRRRVLSQTASCGAHVLALAGFAPRLLQEALQADVKNKVVAKEKWGHLEAVDDDMWALISTPFTTQDFTTVCNGGIIAGEDRVLAVESFMRPKGATWLAEQAKN